MLNRNQNLLELRVRRQNKTIRMLRFEGRFVRNNWRCKQLSSSKGVRRYKNTFKT